MLSATPLITDRHRGRCVAVLLETEVDEPKAHREFRDMEAIGKLMCVLELLVVRADEFARH